MSGECVWVGSVSGECAGTRGVCGAGGWGVATPPSSSLTRSHTRSKTMETTGVPSTA